ncbi:MAG: hypothetical protein AAFQ66_19585, partial [Pseudomonadota bacterium]
KREALAVVGDYAKSTCENAYAAVDESGRNMFDAVVQSTPADEEWFHEWPISAETSRATAWTIAEADRTGLFIALMDAAMNGGVSAEQMRQDAVLIGKMRELVTCLLPRDEDIAALPARIKAGVQTSVEKLHCTQWLSASEQVEQLVADAADPVATLKSEVQSVLEATIGQCQEGN